MDVNSHKPDISRLEEIIKVIIERCWTSDNYEDHLNALVENAQSLFSAFGAIGDKAMETLSHKDDLEAFILNFSWSEQAKSFLILWRDIIFETYKGKIFLLNNEISEKDFINLSIQSRTTIEAATKYLTRFIETETDQLSQSPRKAQKQIVIWSRQQNPFPVYRKQMEDLAKQCVYIQNQFHQLEDNTNHFHTIEKMVYKMIEQCKEEIELIVGRSLKIMEFIKNNIEERVDTIPGYMEEKIDEINITNHLADFSVDLEKTIILLSEKTQISVSTQSGIVQYKELNFRNKVRQWVESETLPLLYEIWEITENTSNGIKMSLLNIRNQTTLLSAESKKTKTEAREIIAPLQAFLIRTENYQLQLHQLFSTLEKRLKKEFNTSNLFSSEQDFLPFRIQSSVTQFNQNEWFEKIWTNLKKRMEVFRQFKMSVEEEVALSDSEKVVRFIQNRTADVENHQYSSIFLTKGYIGESFCVGRKKELEHLQKLVEQWKSNYRGAVILSGQRFSGKSLFGDLAGKRFFQNKIIRLSPNSIIIVEGRRFETSYDIGEALDFIRKHTINSRYLIWIDDFDLWGDAAVSIGQNVRALSQNIDNYSRSNFFMVSMSNWFKSHLQKNYTIDKVFQAEINLDQMSLEEIRKIIFIRHGATHKTLIDEKGRILSPQKIQKSIRQIFKATEGNVGEALIYWSFSTSKSDEEKVIFRYKNLNPPPGFNTDSAILLSTLMIERRTNEYQLRKLFGAPFKEKYSSILQRLISIGLVKRQNDDWLSINEVAANDIGRILERMQYLNFYYKN